MKLLKYSEILERNRALGEALVSEPYRIALLSNIVVNQLGEILEFVLRCRGIRAEVIFGDYDNIVQDSIRLNHVNAVVVFWEAANLVDGLHASAEAMDESHLRDFAKRVENEMQMTLRNLQNVPLVLFNCFSSLLFTQDDLHDGAFQKLCDRLNAALNAMILPHQTPINLNKVIAKVGLSAAADFRQFYSSKALYSIDFLKSYAESIAPAFFAVTGKTRKIIVLDCDNTLWGGILGEEGEDHIKMNSSTREGRIYHEVQQILQGFRKQGILLALCSKNNVDDVDSVLTDHPDMVLRDNELVAKKINWQDKATNMRELSMELNLGLDSFIFVDDSPFEIELIQKTLPEVLCVEVPKTLSNYPSIIRQLTKEFFKFSHSSEDLYKTEMYKREKTRDKARLEFESIDDYLKSLHLVVKVAWNEKVSVARAAQLTQKTNQFNLTTPRYTEADIMRMLAETNYKIATFAVSDRYGDYGITGLTIVQIQQDTAYIETLLMSCRVLGRNVERAFFDNLISKLQSMGVTKLQTAYRKTQKNIQVSNYYDSLGFNVTHDKGDLRKYDLMLADYRKSGIDYIEVKEDVS